LWIVKVKDRFGDYGLVGVTLLKEESDVMTVENFMLSCRVLGKGVEHRIVSCIGEEAARKGKSGIHLLYRRGEKNQPAKDFLEKMDATWEQRGSEQVYSLKSEKAAALQHRMMAGNKERSATGGEVVEKETIQGKVKRCRERWGKIAATLQSVEQIRATIENKRVVYRKAVSSEHEAPRTPVEVKLAEIWCEILGINHVGIHENFFEVGGHSLTGTQVISRAREVFQVEIPLRIIFTPHFTIAELAKTITRLQLEQVDDQELAALLQDIDQLSDAEAARLAIEPRS
jgi:hypothetical protein